MADAHEFLKALAMVLCVAAVTTVLFQKLKQPVVLGYILAGLIIGPHVPIPLVADSHIIQTLSELGVILLMFSLGLEFSLGKLLKIGAGAAITAVVQCSLMLWIGFSVARLLGWSIDESLYAGAIIAISSTTIIAKAFAEQKIVGNLRDLVIAILIVEDLIAILLMAVLTAISSGKGLTLASLGVTAGKLAAFLIALLAVGLLLIPRAIRMILRINNSETTLIASIGICFAISLLAQELGYSVALGAFLAGALVAESGEAAKIEHLLEPVRDMFAAIFFVSVGMLLDPRAVLEHWQAISVLTLVVICGKVLSVSLGSLLTGQNFRTSVRAGMSLAQIGEFSFIIAGLGISLGAIRSFLYPIAVTVSALTTFTTPFLIRASDPVAHWVEGKLPRPLQTFISLYGSWLERLRKAPTSEGLGQKIRGSVKLLLLDLGLLTLLMIGASLAFPKMQQICQDQLHLAPLLSQILIIAGGILLGSPFALGIFRLCRHLGILLSEAALPPSAHGKVDTGSAPRRMFRVALQLLLISISGLLLLALVQPFYPGYGDDLSFGILMLILAILFWRSANHLEGHVRAGAQVIVDTLAAQNRNSGPHAEPSLKKLHELLPGLGEPIAVAIASDSPSVGKSLAELNLRSQTGATVLALNSAEAGLIVPSSQEILRAGDVLALAGSAEAVTEAGKILLGMRLTPAP